MVSWSTQTCKFFVPKQERGNAIGCVGKQQPALVNGDLTNSPYLSRNVATLYGALDNDEHSEFAKYKDVRALANKGSRQRFFAFVRDWDLDQRRLTKPSY